MRSTTTVKAKTCPECSYLNPVEARFCGRCAYDYRPAQAVGDGLRIMAQRGHGITKKRVLIGVALFLFIVVCVCLI